MCSDFKEQAISLGDWFEWENRNAEPEFILLADAVMEMVALIIKGRALSSKMAFRSDIKGIHILIEVEDRETAAILLGRKCANVRAINHLVRAQQIFVHDRFIHTTVKVEGSDEGLRVVSDKNVSGR